MVVMLSLPFRLVFIFCIFFSRIASSTNFHLDKILEKRTPRKVNKDLLLSEHCSASLLSSFHNDQWNKAREALGLKKFEMDQSYFSNSRKIKAFYSFSAGISLFSIKNVLVPYLLIWKAGNDAIRGNLLREEQRVTTPPLRIKGGPEMHVFDSPNGVNHVSYMTELKSYFPKNTQPQNIQPPPAFTFVREPLSHFASGLAEYHFRCTPKKNVTKQTIRQEILDMVNFKALFKEADPCDKVNRYAVRHLYPMSGVLLDYGKDDFNLNYIGKLEYFERDWAKVQEMYHLNFTFDHHIGMHPTSSDPNNVHREFNKIMNSQAASDVAYIEALCHLLLVDYVCFNYPLPYQCKHHAR